MQSEAHASRPFLSMDPGAGTATAANRRGPPFLPLPSASVRLAGASNDRMRRRANGQSAARRPLKGKCGIGGSPSSSSGLRRTAATARAVRPSVSTPSPFPLFYYSVFFRDERGGRSRRPLGIASATVEPVKSDRVELECVAIEASKLRADRSFVHKGRNTSRDVAGSLVSLSDPRQGERGHELCEQLHGKQKR